MNANTFFSGAPNHISVNVKDSPVFLKIAISCTDNNCIQLFQQINSENHPQSTQNTDRGNTSLSNRRRCRGRPPSHSSFPNLSHLSSPITNNKRKLRRRSRKSKRNRISPINPTHGTSSSPISQRSVVSPLIYTQHNFKIHQLSHKNTNKRQRIQSPTTEKGSQISNSSHTNFLFNSRTRRSAISITNENKTQKILTIPFTSTNSNVPYPPSNTQVREKEAHIESVNNFIGILNEALEGNRKVNHTIKRLN